MNGTNLFKIALRALANNKLRAFLTMLGIISAWHPSSRCLLSDKAQRKVFRRKSPKWALT